MYFSRSKKRDTHREFRMEALLQTDGSLVLGVSLCGDDANAWRDFCFLNCNKKFLCLSASLVDFLHAFASSRKPNSNQSSSGLIILDQNKYHSHSLYRKLSSCYPFVLHIRGDTSCLVQGFVKGEEFCWSYPDYFSKLFFVKPNHILLNQSEASMRELVSSLSAFESK